MSTLPAILFALHLFLSTWFSFFYISSFSTQHDLCNAISLLAIYGRSRYGNYGLHLSFNHKASLTLFHFHLSPVVFLCHVTPLTLLFFNNIHSSSTGSLGEGACVGHSMYCVCVCKTFCVLLQLISASPAPFKKNSAGVNSRELSEKLALTVWQLKQNNTKHMKTTWQPFNNYFLFLKETFQGLSSHHIDSTDRFDDKKSKY